MKKIIVVLMLLLPTVLLAEGRVQVTQDNKVGTKAMEVDQTYGASCFIPIEHKRQHDCHDFCVDLYDGDVDIAAPNFYQVTVPANGETLHVTAFFDAVDGAARVLYSTNETVGAAGVTLTAWNPNDACSALPIATFYKDSNTTNASAVYHDISVAGTVSTTSPPNGGKSGGEGASRHELNLVAGKTYIFKVLSLTDNLKGTFLLYGYH